MARPQYLHFKPRCITTLPSLADYHVLIYANGRTWKDVATICCIREHAARLARRRLIFHGLLAPGSPTEPMKWTNATYSIVKRARAIGPIHLPAHADEPRQG